MSQYIPKTAISSVPPSTVVGTDAQPGSPVSRSASAPERASHLMRPLRCAAITQMRIAVATVAPRVAAITCPMAAPPAGGEAAASSVAIVDEPMLPP